MALHRSDCLLVILYVMYSACSLTGVSATDSKFRVEPESKTTVAGAMTIMQCQLRPKYKRSEFGAVRWLFEGRSINATDDQKYHLIDLNGQHILRINAVTLMDAGNYTCLVDGISSSTASLDVLEIPMPWFAQQPADKTAPKGGRVTLNCRVRNLTSSVLKVHWIKGGVVIARNYQTSKINLSKKERSRYSILAREHGDFDLRITGLTFTDSVNFQCAVYLRNNDYVLHSRTVGLKLIYPPGKDYPICAIVQRNSHFEVGDRIETGCISSGGTAPVTLSWLRHNRLKNGTVSDIGSRNDVIIRNKWTLSARDNDKSITCIMSGAAILNERSCKIGPLNVHFQPIMSIRPRVKEIQCCEVVVIKCSTRANPKIIESKWFVDGQNISAEENTYQIKHSNQDETSLFILNTTLESDMERKVINITCEATNSKGVSQVQSQITVVRASVVHPIDEIPVDDGLINKNGNQTVRDKTITTMARSDRRTSSAILMRYATVAIVTAIVIAIVAYVIFRMRRRKSTIGGAASDGQTCDTDLEGEKADVDDKVFSDPASGQGAATLENGSIAPPGTSEVEGDETDKRNEEHTNQEKENSDVKCENCREYENVEMTVIGQS